MGELRREGASVRPHPPGFSLEIRGARNALPRVDTRPRPKARTPPLVRNLRHSWQHQVSGWKDSWHLTSPCPAMGAGRTREPTPEPPLLINCCLKPRVGLTKRLSRQPTQQRSLASSAAEGTPFPGSGALVGALSLGEQGDVQGGGRHSGRPRAPSGAPNHPPPVARTSQPHGRPHPGRSSDSDTVCPAEVCP